MRAIKIKHERALTLNKNFTPVSADEGDEIFPNGIFHFNITKMIDFIHAHPEEFTPERIAVKDYMEKSSSINDAYLDSLNSSEPIIVGEIAPGRYNVIDGNHRMEKARRSGIEYVMAYRLNMNQHIQFMTTQKGYVAYVEYWNSKLKDMRDDER